MINKPQTLLLLTLLVALTLIAAQCGAAVPTQEAETALETATAEQEAGQIATQETTATTAPEQDESVTLRFNFDKEPASPDPALIPLLYDANLTRNLFIGLTDLDPVTAEVLPALATYWEANANSTEWLFHLRNDIPWVYYNPASGETNQAIDDDGKPRFVNAHDVVYSLKRVLRPDMEAATAYVLYSIKGAEELNTGQDANGDPSELTPDDLGVEALDDWTVKFKLEEPAGYFPVIVGLEVARPVPQWAVEKWGEQWAEVGLIHTSGPYVLAEWLPGSELRLLKNPLWFKANEVQIEVVQGLIFDDQPAAIDMYQNNELDIVRVLGSSESASVLADPVLSAEFRADPAPCTEFFGFTHTKPPFDDARVRRAFSAAVDRQHVIDTVLPIGAQAATTFTAPGAFGALESNVLGLSYDPDLAQALLQDFLTEKGLTPAEFNQTYDIVVGHNDSGRIGRIASALSQMWKETLGVDVRVESQEWKIYLRTLDPSTPIEDTFHIWRLGWCGDYPDAHNWLHEVFNFEVGLNRLRRNCIDAVCTKTSDPSRFDELTFAAAAITDPAERARLYAEAEDVLAREEAAYIPLYYVVDRSLVKPWLTWNFPAYGAHDFYNWRIDATAQQEARGE